MMIRVVERRNVNALAQLEALVDTIVADMAEEGALALYEALDSESGGRGVKYASLPNRSSAPGQLPIKQSGRLQGMVDHQQVAPGVHVFGLFPNGADEAKQAQALELGAPRNNLIARAPVRRVGLDTRVHRRMIAVVRRRGG